MADHRALQTQYAFESMEARLPVPKSRADVTAVNKNELQWTGLEQRVREESNSYRTRMLEHLHRNSVLEFIDSPGFGVGRGMPRTPQFLRRDLDNDIRPIPQPGPKPSSTLAESDLREPKDTRLDPLLDMHFKGVLDFVNPRGFGLVVSRQEVAGFQSHQFSAVPEGKAWKVQALELVGLLMHDDPVVYLSDELPRIDRLRKAPMRSLDTFESVGLKRLEAGEDLFVRDTPEGIRMLGAVRSIDQCRKCHDGKRGELLGAFSYTLQRVP